MSTRTEEAIAARERATRGEPEPKPKKTKKAPEPEEADGAEG